MKPVAGISKEAAVKQSMRVSGGPDPEHAPGKPASRIVPFLLRTCVSAGLLYFAFRNSDWEIAATGLRNIRATWLGAGVLVLFVQLLIGALRWSRIAEACAIDLPIMTSVRYTMIAGFFGQMLPSTVGADGTRIWLLGRSSGQWSKTTYSVVIDRIAGCLAIAFLVIACFPAISARITDPAGKLGLIVLGAGSVVALAAVPLLAIIPRTRLARVPVARHAMAIADVLRDFFTFSHAGAAVAVYSVAVHLLSGVAVWCLAHALSAPLGLVDALILLPPVMLIAMIPVSVAGWGVRESAMVAILHYGGMTNAAGFLISVLFGLSLLFLGILGGGIWIWNSRKARAQ